ncbi:glycosyltransferase [Saccharibacillus qingshengii]|uniref:glycosyltransferase n=1 Tax=Saccharibacillus qingshengii TaxID=1763540 RepID=UPI001552ECE5|nr:glycosyltransferase [Saccharibacillus qingshengii]
MNGTSKDIALSFSYLRRLTDDTGIFQHTKFGVPDRSKGYTSDDNARALIAAALAYTQRKDEESLTLSHTYLSFLYDAQNPDGSFRNFMNYDRAFAEKIGSDDCQGRCIWALGCAIAESTLPDNLRNTCKYMVNQALPVLERLRSPRAMAYALIGLTSILEAPDCLVYAFPYPDAEPSDPDFLPRERIEALTNAMAERLRENYRIYRTDDWHWYENSLTYGNAMIPWAMLKASRLPGRGEDAVIAKESLDFLIDSTFASEGYFKPIGSGGWYTKGGSPALYDEQPIEACETMLACLEAHVLFEEPAYYERALRCCEWFHGGNSLREPLIDAQTGACYDGIHAQGLNLNQGSENIISYCTVLSVMPSVRQFARNSVPKEG